METTPTTGLSDADVLRFRAEAGFNELPTDRKHTLDIVLSVLREPMLLLLLVSAVIYLLMGDHTEAILLIASAVAVVTINVVQDLRSSRALQALKDLTSPRALVIREGTERRIPARELVPGDILLLSEGDRVAADATILSSMNLVADESLLTGESVPVLKQSSMPEQPTKQASVEAGSKVFSGSLIVGGTATTLVSATGPATELGKIGSALATIVEGKTPLEVQTGFLVRKLAIVAFAACLLTTVLFHLTRGGWTEAILAGVALAMALLPEEYGVVLSVFLALGARKLSMRGILIRRMSAVEALGTVTTLCVDKTGTLTKNEMSLMELYTPETGIQPVHRGAAAPSIGLVRSAYFSSRPKSFDPMDRAVFTAVAELQVAVPQGELLQQIPITAEQPILTQVWRLDEKIEVAVKGAPETVFALCNTAEDVRINLQTIILNFAERGLRVLGVAQAVAENIEERLQSYSFHFLGLLAFADPLRDGIAEAVGECYNAGIRVVMITGDHPETARSIARQAGIRLSENVVTGKELQTHSDATDAQISTTTVFARVAPTQKLQIVQALRASGEVVVMTGDGVNDAPALKAANIGVAMGGRGTDVARESGAAVLTHDDFGSLVTAVRLGRRTYDNIKKAMYYIVAVHIPIAGLSLLPLLLGLPLVLYPIHIVLLELLLDPMSTLVFESEGEESNVMLRPPRDPRAQIFQRQALVLASLQGLSVLAMCSIVYFFASRVSEVEARTLTFVTLILSNFCLALVNRSWSKVFWATLRVPNRALWWVISFGLVSVLAITQLPLLASLFHFGAFHLHDWIICGAAAAFSLTWFELLKLLTKRPLTL